MGHIIYKKLVDKQSRAPGAKQVNKNMLVTLRKWILFLYPDCPENPLEKLVGDEFGPSFIVTPTFRAVDEFRKLL